MAAEPIIGVPANAANREPRDGYSVLMHHLLRALADAPDAPAFRLYLRKSPEYPFLDRPPRMQPVVLPEPRLVARLAGRFFGKRRWEALALGPEIFRRPPDLFLHVGHEFPPPILRRPSVAIIFDLAFRHPEYADHFSPDDLARLTAATGRSLARCRHAIAISGYTAGEITGFYGIPAERITVVHPGVENRGLAPEPARRDRPYFLSVSTIQPRKYLPEVFAAFAKAERGGLDAELLVVGRKGWRADDELAGAAAAGCSRWKYLGELPTAEVTALAAGAVAFVTAARDEGFGLPVLEAMAAGTPVIAARSGALPEVVGEAGILYTPGDVEGLAREIARLCRDQNARAALAEAGARRARALTWDRTAQQLVELLRRVASGS